MNTSDRRVRSRPEQLIGEINAGLGAELCVSIRNDANAPDAVFFVFTAGAWLRCGYDWRGGFFAPIDITMAVHKKLYVRDTLYVDGDVQFADGPFALTTGAALTATYALTYPSSAGAVNSIVTNPAGDGTLTFDDTPDMVSVGLVAPGGKTTLSSAATAARTIVFPAADSVANAVLAATGAGGALTWTTAPTFTGLTVTPAPITQSVSAILTVNPNPLNRAFSLFSTAGGAVVATLPAAEANKGRIFNVMLLTAGNNLTITAAGTDTIEGDATLILNVAGQHAQLCSLGDVAGAGVGRWVIT